MSVATAERYVAARFDALRERFPTEVEANDPRRAAVLESLDPLAGRRVLDLGCGKGRFARMLTAAGAEVIGLDVSRGMLASAMSLRRVCASARRLPLPDAGFDAVAAIEVIQHVPEVEPVLAEIHRVLRPGGRLAIVDKNAASFDAARPWLPSAVLKWIDERRGFWMYPPDAPFRERWYRPGTLSERLNAAGFGEIKVAHLLEPREASRFVFRCFPRLRLMALWTARKPECE